MSSEYASQAPAPTEDSFRVGLDDAIIVPLTLAGLAAKILLRVALSILILILDYAFPIALQLARFPLFTIRILGDGVAAILKGVVRLLPVGDAKRETWRARVSRNWASLRQKISYKAFEEAVHHAFEGGMAWVFARCKTLTPRAALIVIAGAALWLPVSFGAATAIHAVLLAKAAVLPAWMQLLHPLATIVAKSKLLVLPVYPAAWPQAKKHPAMLALAAAYQRFKSLYLVRKTGHRYRQTELAARKAVDGMGRLAISAGLIGPANRFLERLNSLAAWIGKVTRDAIGKTVDGLSAVPLLGRIVGHYAVHYDGATLSDSRKLSEKTRSFFERWSIKFTSEYYERRECADAAKSGTGTDDPDQGSLRMRA